MFTHSLTTLDSGLPVISIPIPAVKSVTVLVLVNTGSRYSKEGIAHFFEHMVFKGTQKFPNAQSLAATVDSVGADFNAFTSKEYTGYYVQGLPANTFVSPWMSSPTCYSPHNSDKMTSIVKKASSSKKLICTQTHHHDISMIYLIG